MQQLWPIIHQQNSDGECVQRFINPICLLWDIFSVWVIAKIVSWYIGLFIHFSLFLFFFFFYFSQLVIFSSDNDRLCWVDRYWLCSQTKMIFKIRKSLKQMPFDSVLPYVPKKWLCQKFTRYGRKFRHVSKFKDSGFKTYVPLRHPSHRIFHEAELE